jgi:hypothetical protein
MPDEPPPRRTPGGFVRRTGAAPKPPESNGHTPDRPLGLLRSAWGAGGDAEEERATAADRTAFKRVADIQPAAEVQSSGRPSIAVLVGVLIVVGVVVLAVVLYRMAPP